ncbi:MAG: hypothetical protein GAK29_04345 [Acinetobacter bereziniae]|uniref:Uncharacterized protein n=1 Tax=Acinetobacter bereziniae TaxID=106648 RepID=A0A833URG3_ACIBZ|nr:MAG: hypothetical protein GAK29_04345 [Acinetobacter bereziniae]
MNIENESNESTIDNNIDEEELDILDENYIEQYASNDELADLIVEKLLQHDDLNRLLLSIKEENSRSRYREPYHVCRRLNILRNYSDEKIKLYP